MSATSRCGPTTVTVLDDRDALDELRSQWDALWASSPSATPYNHRLWVTTWLDHFAGDDQLHVVAIRDGDELVGLAPFVETRLVRAVRPFAVLLAAGAELADDGEPLLGCGGGVAGRALAAHLLDLVHRSTTSVVVPRLVDDGPLVRSLTASGFDPVELSDVARLSIRFDLLDDPARALDRVARKRDIPRARRRLGERFDVEFVVEDAASEALEAMLALQQRIRDADEERGLFSTGRTRDFARDAVEALADAGVAKLSALKVDGRPLAIGLGYVAGGRYVGHKLAYDTDLRKYGPGHLLIHELAANALAQGLSEYDMGRGDAPYKQQWCNRQRRAVTLALLRPGRLRPVQRLVQRAILSRRVARLGR